MPANSSWTSAHDAAWENPDFGDPANRLRLMEAVVGAGGDAIIVVELADDGAPCIVFVNEAFTRTTGWTADEVLGRSPAMLVGAATAPEAEIAYRKVVTERAPASVEAAQRRKDGSTFWVDSTMLPVVDDGRCTHVLSFQRDITTRRESDRALRESEERFRALAEHASDVITVIDRDGSIRYTSPSVEWLLGYPPGSYDSMLDLVHPDDQEMVAVTFAERLDEPGVGDAVELRLQHADGSWREVEALTKNLLDDPLVEGIVVTVRDITDRKRAERMLAGQAQVLGLLLAGRPLEESLTAVALLLEEQAPGSRCAILRHDPTTGALSCVAAPNLPASYRAAVDDHVPGCGSACDAAREGTAAVVTDVSGSAASLNRAAGSLSNWALPVMSPGGEVIAVVTAYHDRVHEPTAAEWSVLERGADLVAIVLERERTAAELAHRATYDPVTDLPNRSLVLDRIRLSLARLEGRQRYVAVLAVSVDRLERVADSMGHETAQDVRITVGSRLQHARQPEDTVGDLGGLFVVVAEVVDAVRGAVALAEGVAKAVAAPHALPQGPVFLTGSIGIALGTSTADHAEALLDDAVTAMRRASEAGGGRYELFDSELRNRVVERIRVENGLHRALQRGELALHYQPVINVADGTPVSVEALVRWHDPERGLVSPADFIPVAEDSGLIVPLGEWVLETACAQLAQWKRDGTVDRGFSVAVNVSPRQLGSGLLETVVGSVAATGLERGDLCIEVTETTVMSDLEASLEMLRRIRASGVQVAVDDFGTGHSSLGLLQRIPADMLKIDRSFISQMDGAESPIPAVIVNLAHGLGLVAVTEGVETTQQDAMLHEIGCDRSQGFLHSPPLPADEAARWLRRFSDGAGSVD